MRGRQLFMQKAVRAVMLAVMTVLYPLSAALCLADSGRASKASSAELSENRQTIETLLQALDGKDSFERHRAVIALGKSGDSAALDPLIKALEDNDYFVRGFAARALSDLGDPAAVDPLIAALKDSNNRVRRSAAEALGRLGARKALNPLIELLSDPDIFMQRSAAMALGYLRDPASVVPLVELLREEDSFVRSGAEIALMNIGNEAIPHLYEALGDWASGPTVARLLHDMGWQPKSQEERVHYNVASRNRRALLEDWEETRQVLIDDANDGTGLKMETAVLALIGIGHESTMEELKSILESRGNARLAQAFHESGNVHLAEFARTWIDEKGADRATSGEIPAVRWGGL
jgi:HEAT repeat protein